MKLAGLFFLLGALCASIVVIGFGLRVGWFQGYVLYYIDRSKLVLALWLVLVIFAFLVAYALRSALRTSR